MTEYKFPDDPGDQAFLVLMGLGAAAAVGTIGYAAYKAAKGELDGPPYPLGEYSPEGHYVFPTHLRDPKPTREIKLNGLFGGSGGFPLPSPSSCNVCSGDIANSECPLHGGHDFLTGDSVRAFADSDWAEEHDLDPDWLRKKASFIDSGQAARARQARGAVWAAVQDAKDGRL